MGAHDNEVTVDILGYPANLGGLDAARKAGFHGVFEIWPIEAPAHLVDGKAAVRRVEFRCESRLEIHVDGSDMQENQPRPCCWASECATWQAASDALEKSVGWRMTRISPASSPVRLCASAKGQNRASGLFQHRAGDAPGQETVQSGPPMSSHRDQVRTNFVGETDDLARRWSVARRYSTSSGWAGA